MNHSLLASIRALPKTQQLELANTILDDLADAGDLPMTDATRVELERRLAAFDADPDSGQPWEEVREELFGKK